MIVKINAVSHTHPQDRIETIFRTHIESILDKAKEFIETNMKNDPDRDEVLGGLKILRENITNDSPIEVIDAISWNWQTGDNADGCGSWGKATIYIGTVGLNPNDIGIISIEIDKSSNHLNVIVEVI